MENAVPKPNSGVTAIAAQDDITAVLGHIDADKLLAILSLQPTVSDLETANRWMAGDADAYGSKPPLKRAASEIVTILTTDEEDEPRATPWSVMNPLQSLAEAQC
jgi:hypothetical protein